MCLLCISNGCVNLGLIYLYSILLVSWKLSYYLTELRDNIREGLDDQRVSMPGQAREYPTSITSRSRQQVPVEGGGDMIPFSAFPIPSGALPACLGQLN